MKTIQIGDKAFAIKDYYCSEDENYFEKKDGKLWLYVNITNNCQAQCPFCVNPENKLVDNSFDLDAFRSTLKRIKDHIYGISITGGEPLLVPQLIDDVVSIISNEIPEGIEIDMVTNGVCLERVLGLRNLSKLDSIHISRHMISDEENQKLMGTMTPTIEQIASVASQIDDQGKFVFNCVLHKGGVDSSEKARQYLEMAAKAHVHNSSFIGMFHANEYCKVNYVDPRKLNFENQSSFNVWNHFHDYDFCSCSTGSYRAENGTVGYYYRCPGNKKAEYARQLVYTSDNRLLTGFSGEEITF